MNVKKVAENLVTKMLLPEIAKKKELGRNHAYIDVPLFAQTKEVYNEFLILVHDKGYVPCRNSTLTLFGCSWK